MRNQLITLVALFGFMTNANAELSQSELNKLTSQQRQIYLNQLKELNARLRQLDMDLFKAEDRIKMGEEMNREPGTKAGNFYIAQGMEMKEKAIRGINETKNTLVLLDQSAREAIKRNERE